MRRGFQFLGVPLTCCWLGGLAAACKSDPATTKTQKLGPQSRVLLAASPDKSLLVSGPQSHPCSERQAIHPRPFHFGLHHSTGIPAAATPSHPVSSSTGHPSIHPLINKNIMASRQRTENPAADRRRRPEQPPDQRREPRYHVYIRLPFNRGDFVDPETVSLALCSS